MTTSTRPRASASWAERLMPDLSQLLVLWRALARVPLGRRVFDRLIGRFVPYTGSIDPEVLELEEGYARVRLRDRRRVRNHLRSVHAVALINLAELTASLAVSTRQPPDGRWIVTGLDTDFVKKARGPIEATCRMEVSDWSEPRDVVGEVVLKDGAGDVVARTRPRWRIGPRPPR